MFISYFFLQAVKSNVYQLLYNILVSKRPNKYKYFIRKLSLQIYILEKLNYEFS